MAATGTTGGLPCPPEEISEEIRGRGPALVALSGGVDSAVVALLAHRALGQDALAATLSGPAVSPPEIDRARAVARSIGVRHVVLEVDPIADPEYRVNPSNRCYFCRRSESAVLTGWGRTHGIRQYLDGLQVDDLSDDRPGIAAMDEAGFLHPLVVGRWRKSDVRAFARRAGLPNWDQPSDACLASRVQHGQPISADLLGRVHLAERRLLDRGFRRVRVRIDGARARVVVEAEAVARLLAEPVASEVHREILELGFENVELDPHGYIPRAGA
ncbi:MAG TPA: ATP-dependent sacrificial sulfur transferase LarE [Thermoplasmata archaeon]|nr:ATP-dependent sacrificial sulfur transferase LarE [Thermoplasmata archaeon]